MSLTVSPPLGVMAVTVGADGLTVRLMAVEPMAVNSIFVVEGSQGITRPKVDRAVSRSG